IRDKLVTGVQTCALPIWMPEEFQSRQDFSLSAERDGERLLIACAGELDLTTAPELEELMITSAPYGELEIDLAHLEFIDSSGLRSEERRVGKEGRSQGGG